MRPLKTSRQPGLGVFAQTLSYLLLALPTVVLGLLAFHTNSVAVGLGAAAQFALLVIFRKANPVWQPPASGSIVIAYLIALATAWASLPNSTDPIPHIAQGGLFLVAVGLFAFHDLIRTGAEPLRRANKWSRRIVNRRSWPADLAECRTVPEAISLRKAMYTEPTPALALLMNVRQEVQIAALGALEHHPHWRDGEAEMVLRHAHKNPEPAIRAAAVYALAGVENAELVNELAAFLRDPAAEVRLATAEALMWNSEARWPYARDLVKEALADPKLANEGPLFTTAGRLPAAAIADLIMWSSEHPPLARRAILTVVEHFHGDLLNAERPELANEIATMMLSNETAPALRVELAGLLRDHHMLTPDLLDRLTNMNQPAPMRLFAAELMLKLNPNDPDGVDVLRGLARQPNRELALNIAAVLQNVLGMQLGLPAGHVQPQSKQAADVAKRVLAWANGASPESLTSTPGPRPGLKPGSRGRSPGLAPRGKAPGLPPTSIPYTNPLDESMLPPEDGAGFLSGDDLRTPPELAEPMAPRSPLDESMLAPPRSPLDESMLAPPRSPLEDSMMAPRDRDLYDDGLQHTPVPPPRSPLEESMLMHGEPLAEDDLLAPPKPRSPLDESMLTPEPPPAIPPLIPPSKKPFKRPGQGGVF